MPEIINLNQKRKAKAKVQKAQRATENRIKFGRTKAEKQAEVLRVERIETLLKGHKREREE